MSDFRISQAADLLGVSDDTVRRWIDSHSLASTVDDTGRMIVSGVELAAFAARRADSVTDPSQVRRSARNRLVGIVTGIRADTVMAQVDMQCGPQRIVSLMSAEAVRDLDLTVGALAVAVVKATNVIVEVPTIG